MSIRVQGLVKEYSGKRALDGVSFELGTGELVGFLGPNGAGKSTTLKLLTGYLTPTAGSAVVCGCSLTTHSLQARRQLGYLPEHNPLYLELYVNEYLRYAGSLQGMKGRQLSQRIQQVVEQVGLGSAQHQRITKLSKGYRQRVGIAQAILHDPAVLLLDEPTSGLDPNQVVEIRELLRTLAKSKTVLLSSHLLPEVQQLATRILILHKGRLMLDSATNAVATQPGELEKLFQQLTAA